MVLRSQKASASLWWFAATSLTFPTLAHDELSQTFSNYWTCFELLGNSSQAFFCDFLRFPSYSSCVVSHLDSYQFSWWSVWSHCPNGWQRSSYHGKIRACGSCCAASHHQSLCFQFAVTIRINGVSFRLPQLCGAASTSPNYPWLQCLPAFLHAWVWSSVAGPTETNSEFVPDLGFEMASVYESLKIWLAFPWA